MGPQVGTDGLGLWPSPESVFSPAHLSAVAARRYYASAMHPLRIVLLLALVLAPPLAAGPSPAVPAAAGDDVPDTPLGTGVHPQPVRTFRAADFIHLSEARLKMFLVQRRALTPVLAQDAELGERFRELCARARDGSGTTWECAAREPAMARAVRGATGADPVEYFRLHALVAAAYDQYVAIQDLADLTAPARGRELAAARAAAASSKPSRAEKEQARAKLAQAEDTRRKVTTLLITGFPRSLLSVIARHEKDLQALEDVEDEGLAPTEPALEPDAGGRVGPGRSPGSKDAWSPVEGSSPAAAPRNVEPGDRQ